ncbi:MAG: glycosyltransferase [Anaerolineae bacterium]|nr:glycosyltransferase [Anaerolineae bacterium]
MPEPLRCSIGVMAYNEERNIGNLLQALCAQQLDTVAIGEVVVVASGCTDNTECVVQDEMACDARIRLLVQERREGKMSAINLFRWHAQYDIVVIINADVLPEPDCIEHLVAPFADPDVGITGGRPVPVNEPDSLTGFAAHLLWEMHHQVSLSDPKMGELVAYCKFPDLLISPDTVDDEGIVEELVHRKQMRKVYVPEAVLYLRGPTTVREFVKRRRNIYAGHLQLRARTRYTPSTFSTLGLVRKLFCPMLGMTGAHPMRLLRAAGVVLLEVWARVLGAYDFYVARRDHRIWEPADSSKEIITRT